MSCFKNKHTHVNSLYVSSSPLKFWNHSINQNVRTTNVQVHVGPLEYLLCMAD